MLLTMPKQWLLSGDHLHTHVISGLFAGLHACSCTNYVHMEIAELHHSTAHIVVTTFKEKVWFGAHCHGSTSFEN